MINYIVYLCMVLQVLLPDYLGHMLGHGDLQVKLTVQAAAFTASARTKIEAAGGSCEVI